MSLSGGAGINKNRGRLDIVKEMLSIASVRVRKTRIMYGANLSFVQVERYLSFLLGSGLLKHDGDSGYSITGTGLEFLQLYEDYLERCKRLKGEIERNMKDKLKLEKMCFNDKSDVSQIGIVTADLKRF